jgi:hypothetical protein
VTAFERVRVVIQRAFVFESSSTPSFFQAVSHLQLNGDDDDDDGGYDR